MSDDLIERLRKQDMRQRSGGYFVFNGIMAEAAQALTEARAEIERLREWKQNQFVHWPMEIERRNRELAAAESELSTLRAHVREVVGPLVHACEADYVGDVCKDEDPNESVALGEDGPSALTFGMIYAARQLNEDLK